MGKRNMCMWAEPGAHTLQSSKPHSGGERDKKTGEKGTSIRGGVVSKSVIYLQQTLMPNNMNIDNVCL